MAVDPSKSLFGTLGQNPLRLQTNPTAPQSSLLLGGAGAPSTSSLTSRLSANPASQLSQISTSSAGSSSLSFQLQSGSQPLPSSSLASRLSSAPSSFLSQGSQLGKSTALGGNVSLGANPGSQLQNQTPLGLKLGQQPRLQQGSGLSLLSKQGGLPSTAPTLSSLQPNASQVGHSIGATLASTVTTMTPKPQSTVSLSSAGQTIPAGGYAPSAPRLTYKKLEDQINKWAVELEEQERQFLDQAQKINDWDRLLIGNADKILKLNTEVEEIKANQQRLDNELEFIITQQSELEGMLDSLEGATQSQDMSPFDQHADQERNRTYHLAENLDSQLKRMGQDLKDIIEHLNTQSAESESTMAPIHHIAKILNLHMESLQWVDQNAALMKKKVEEVSRMCDARRREQENTFRLAFE
eukprot:m.309152 g.309152  ORF g.309152 m.309152 type:complete len:411 (+) comp45640_c0_seq1:12-1244(+)